MNSNPLLTGIRVLDLSRLLPGPFSTLYLAQLGAEVIKIEEPKGGDYCRSLSPEMFTLVNRGKKSVTLDLRNESHVKTFYKLVETADVLIESFRPGVMDKLGCGYEVLKKINPRLVYAALTGYGQTGPYSQRPGHDMNYRGYAGDLSQNGAIDSAPVTGNFQVADLAGGALTCLTGVLAALIGAKSSGIGSFVDVSMMDGTMALQVATLTGMRTLGKSQAMGAGFLSGDMPNYSVYQCADNKFIALGAVEYKFFANFCNLAGRADLLKLPFASGAKGQALRDELTALFKTKTRDEWDALVAHEETCVSAVLSMDEALNNPQVLARKVIQNDASGKPVINMPIQFSNAETNSGNSPELGADNDHILGQLEN